MISHNLALYIFTVMLFLFFMVASIGFLTMMFSKCAEWNYNKSKPVLSAKAKVISKRFKSFQDTQSFGDMIPSYNYSNFYYITFELEDGEQLEFSVTAVEYEDILEGDTGKLNYQVNRYLGFEKNQ